MTKRNPQGGGTIRQRKDGRWEARYTAGRDPGTGKQVQRSIYGKTQSEVRKKLQKITTSIDEGIYIAPCDLTVAQWLDIWLKDFTSSVKPLTVKSYTTIAKTHLKPNLGAIGLTTLGTHQIQSVYNKLIAAGLLSPNAQNAKN